MTAPPDLLPSAIPLLRFAVARLMPMRDGTHTISPDTAAEIARALNGAADNCRQHEAVAIDPDPVAYDLFALAGAFEARAKTGALVNGNDARRILATLHQAISACEKMEHEDISGREWHRSVRGRA